MILLFRDNIDSKVYVRNLPIEKASDEELLDFFKPFGKVSGLKFEFDHLRPFFFSKF
jgi:RNA recognition motif-containing protein